MLLAALPPVLAVLWSLGLLGWIGFKLNLFSTSARAEVMVMGLPKQHADGVRHPHPPARGYTKAEPCALPCRVGAGLRWRTARRCCRLCSSRNRVIRTFGMAGVLATGIPSGPHPCCVLGLVLIRNRGKPPRTARLPTG
jgi:hypothetical protein